MLMVILSPSGVPIEFEEGKGILMQEELQFIFIIIIIYLTTVVVVNIGTTTANYSPH